MLPPSPPRRPHLLPPLAPRFLQLLMNLPRSSPPHRDFHKDLIEISRRKGNKGYTEYSQTARMMMIINIVLKSSTTFSWRERGPVSPTVLAVLIIS